MDSDSSEEDYVPPSRRRLYNPEPHVVTVVKSETGNAGFDIFAGLWIFRHSEESSLLICHLGFGFNVRGQVSEGGKSPFSSC